MDKFFALSAPIRRQILALLADGEQLTSSAIADKFKISPPAISQHLKVLLESDLVKMQKKAQQHIYELNPISFHEIENWASNMVHQIETVGGLADRSDDSAIESGAE